MVGDETLKGQSYLRLSHPMDNGIIKNWEDMVHLWDYTFKKKLGIEDLSDHSILLTEPVMNPDSNREKMVEIMFEKFGFNAVYVAIQAILTLYAQGLQTGIVVDSGDGVTHIIPVYEGVSLTHHSKRLNIAGRDITKYLISLLLRRGYSLNKTTDFEIAREIKEKLCYVGYDIEMERLLSRETTALVEVYTLPDGRIIKMDTERYQAPEILFSPYLIDVDSPGLAEQLFQSINSTDVDIRPGLYRHIILSGGTSMYPGFPSRLEKEIKDLYVNKVLKGDTSRLAKMRIKVEDPPRRKHMAFVGGAVLASIMKDRKDFWIFKKDWEEHGASILHKDKDEAI